MIGVVRERALTEKMVHDLFVNAKNCALRVRGFFHKGSIFVGKKIKSVSQSFSFRFPIPGNNQVHAVMVLFFGKDRLFAPAKVRDKRFRIVAWNGEYSRWGVDGSAVATRGFDVGDGTGVGTSVSVGRGVFVGGEVLLGRMNGV